MTKEYGITHTASQFFGCVWNPCEDGCQGSHRVAQILASPGITYRPPFMVQTAAALDATRLQRSLSGSGGSNNQERGQLCSIRSEEQILM
jgi:hypothetical protein